MGVPPALQGNIPPRPSRGTHSRAVHLKKMGRRYQRGLLQIHQRENVPQLTEKRGRSDGTQTGSRTSVLRGALVGTRGRLSKKLCLTPRGGREARRQGGRGRWVCTREVTGLLQRRQKPIQRSRHRVTVSTDGTLGRCPRPPEGVWSPCPEPSVEEDSEPRTRPSPPVPRPRSPAVRLRAFPAPVLSARPPLPVRSGHHSVARTRRRGWPGESGHRPPGPTLRQPSGA